MSTAARSEAQREVLIVAALVHLAFGLVVGLEFAGLLPRLERAAYDLFLNQVATSETGELDPVVVEYTAADEERYGYPLPDRYLADLLDKLAEAGSLAIGLDLIRDRPEPPNGRPVHHQRLNKALTTYDVIAVLKETGDGFPPPRALADQPLQLGFADVVKDPDGLVRRGLLFLTTPAGTTRPSLALQLAGRALLADGITPVWQGDRLRLGATDYVRLRPQASSLYASTERTLDEGGYQLLLSYPDCGSAYRRLSIAEVLDGAASGLDLENRLVLIGNTVKVYKDYFDVPVDCAGAARGEMFGVHLHARVATQLIQQARGDARPIETLAQRFASPTLGQTAELGWVWWWCVLAGVTSTLINAPLRLAAALIGEAALIIAAGFAAFLGARLWLPVAVPLVGAALAATTVIAYLMTRARSEREQLMDLFSATVSGRVAKTIWKARAALGSPGKLPPKLMMATVLFSDIRGFSTISTMLPESRLATWLNLYMEAMVDVVERHGGVIEKFAGDGLTVEFGVPDPRETDAEVAADAQAAVSCALAMADSLETLNRALAKRDLPQIAIRIGIHSGPLMVGVIGTSKRWQYSVIGDTANTAARLESHGKDDPHLAGEADHFRILISEATYHLLEGRYAATAVGTLEMRNRGPISVYRISGVRRPEADENG